MICTATSTVVAASALEIFARYARDGGELDRRGARRWSAQAPKRVGAQFVERRRATWDHRKLGRHVLTMDRLEGPDPVAAARARACARSPTPAPSSSCRSPTSRCSSTASRRWPTRASRRSGSSSRPRPATRSARPPATARSSACAITYIVQDEPAGPRPRGAHRRAVPRRRRRSSCTSATTCCRAASPTSSTPFARATRPTR